MFLLLMYLKTINNINNPAIKYAHKESWTPKNSEEANILSNPSISPQKLNAFKLMWGKVTGPDKNLFL